MESISENLQARIEQLRTLYAERNMPEEWLYDILRDIHIWCVHSMRHGGPYALPDRQEKWFDVIFSGQLLRIGRLQYMKSQFGGMVVVFRKNDEIAVMAEDGLFFDEQGYWSEKGWQSVLRSADGSWEGSRIINGRAECGLTKLDAEEWKVVLRRFDPMVTIHIPEDGPMDAEACRQSLKRAAEWFSQTDPDWNGFCCQSWLLNPVFQDFLPETSNIIQFQKIGSLFPMSKESDALARVYPGKLRDFILSKQAEGFTFRSGGWFILGNDILKKINKQ